MTSLSSIPPVLAPSSSLRSVAGGMAKPGAALPPWLIAANAETRAAAEESLRQRRPARNPFVWVHGSDLVYPGIVMDRRRVGAGWQILVAYTCPRWDLIEQWLDAEQLSPHVSEATAG